MKPPETINKLKGLAVEAVKALGKSADFSGSLEIHFHKGQPKAIDTHEKEKLTFDGT